MTPSERHDIAVAIFAEALFLLAIAAIALTTWGVIHGIHRLRDRCAHRRDTADGTWWPVDLEAQDALYAHLDAAEAIDDGLDRMFTRLGPPDSYEPAPGSDPWLRDLWPDAPEWEDA